MVEPRDEQNIFNRPLDGLGFDTTPTAEALHFSLILVPVDDGLYTLRIFGRFIRQLVYSHSNTGTVMINSATSIWDAVVTQE